MPGFLIGVAVGVVVGGVAVWAWRRGPRRSPARDLGPNPGTDPLRERADLISKIAHELKNPIVSVMGLASTGSRLYGSLEGAERQDLPADRPRGRPVEADRRRDVDHAQDRRGHARVRPAG